MKIKLGTLDQGVFDLAGTGKENLKLAVVRSKKQPVLTSEPKMQRSLSLSMPRGP